MRNLHSFIACLDLSFLTRNWNTGNMGSSQNWNTDFSQKLLTEILFKKLSFTAVNFIRSENNLALLHLFIDARNL